MTYRHFNNETTRSSVLKAVANVGNEAAWARFFDLYAGFVFTIARSRGLSAEDADDVVQGVFVDLSRQMPTFDYDRARGKFRSYLFGLVNWRITDKLKANKRESDSKAAYLNETAVSAGDAAFIEREWQEAALNEALRRLKAEVNADHFAAFVESTVEGIDTESVVKLHGLTRDNLYQIRTRLTAKLKPLVAEVLKEMNEGKMPRMNGGDPRS